VAHPVPYPNLPEYPPRATPDAEHTDDSDDFDVFLDTATGWEIVAAAVSQSSPDEAPRLVTAAGQYRHLIDAFEHVTGAHLPVTLRRSPTPLA
jgi:hypothetical protein